MTAEFSSHSHASLPYGEVLQEGSHGHGVLNSANQHAVGAEAAQCFLHRAMLGIYGQMPKMRVPCFFRAPEFRNLSPKP